MPAAALETHQPAGFVWSAECFHANNRHWLFRQAAWRILEIRMKFSAGSDGTA
jgi:hypothetical protein